MPVPFSVHVPDEVLVDLRSRLGAVRLPSGVTGSGGVPLDEATAFLDRWRTGFDWRRQEAWLNSFDHFRESLGGLQVHFLHHRSSRPSATPLLLLHGWPGSFVEMLDMLPILARTCHVVVPSLPGYGFSDAPSEAGWSNARMADLFAELMHRLSYDRFAVHGGDWGAGIATWLARSHPHRVAALHLNYIPGSFAPEARGDVTPEEERFLHERDAWTDAHYGYGHIQRTRPLTLGYALSDSAAGMGLWIWEKFREWEDPSGPIDRDRILTNITLYWVTNTIAPSMRLYLESARTPLRFAAGERLAVPCAVVRCPFEAPFPPRSWVERVFDVRRWRELPRGGHFAAMEVPELLAADIAGFLG
jgi:pimeloyl-ACP methyl ester carboxylesterase